MTFEYALGLLPHCNATVTQPCGTVYEGKKFAGLGLCGVSILRAGETMEKALMKGKSSTSGFRYTGSYLHENSSNKKVVDIHYLFE